jgi:hypothetical protein
MATSRTDIARDDADIAHPREMLTKLMKSIAQLDKTRLIQTAVENPGARVMWALKLGRFPMAAQEALRDQNTVAGVLSWLYVLHFLLGVAAAA